MLTQAKQAQGIQKTEINNIQGKPLALSLCSLTARVFINYYRYTKCSISQLL